jgi:uncharacterized protein YqeY
MKNKEKDKQLTYKSILENAQKAAKEKQDTVNDEYLIAAARREIKQLEDLLGFCEAGSDRETEVKNKIGFAKELLPQAASADEMLAYLQAEQVEKNMGACMKALKAKFANSLDNKAASAVAKEYCK